MKEKNGEHPFGDAGQMIFLGLFVVVWVGDSFFLRKSTSASDVVPLYVRLVCFGISVVAAVFLVKSGHEVVSHDRPASSLMTSGAFRFVRHPLYLGIVIFYLGLALVTASLFSLLVFVVIFLFYNYIASYEERLLEVRFGVRCRNYRDRTGKWAPKIGSRGQKSADG